MSTTLPSACASCGLYGKGRGFCLGVGDPAKAKMALILEGPAEVELGFWLNTPAATDVVPNPREELQRRQGAFPELPKSALVKGVPVVGRTGSILNNWLLPKAGIVRSECFVDNTVRCVAPRSKQGSLYPVGADKNSAERTCRQYDRIQEFRPDAIVLTYHPAALMREITALPLIIKDLEKAQAFVKQGLRTLVLMGGHAAEVFLGYGSNVSRWRGHYELTASRGGADAWYERVLARVSSRVKGGGKRKSKAAQLAAGNAIVIGDVLDVKAPKKRKGGCVCGETKAAHPTASCPTYRSKRVAATQENVVDSIVTMRDDIVRGGEGLANTPEQLGERQAERLGQDDQRMQANVPATVLNEGEVGAGEAGAVGEVVLGPPSPHAQPHESMA